MWSKILNINCFWFSRIISPCRSLCVSVRDSCAPIMNCYGYPWPRILQCDQFPKDHLMCISSVANLQNGTSNEGRGTQRSFFPDIPSFVKTKQNNDQLCPINWFLCFCFSGAACKLHRLWIRRSHVIQRTARPLL